MDSVVLMVAALAANAATDPEWIATAERLPHLTDPAEARTGAYTVDTTVTGDRSVAAHTIHGGARTGDPRP